MAQGLRHGALDLRIAGAAAGGGLAVTWVNERTESGLPYDVKAEWTAPGGEKVTTLIEVKTTR